MQIVASDRGEPPNDVSTTLTVDILDVNDETPTFAERKTITQLTNCYTVVFLLLQP